MLRPQLPNLEFVESFIDALTVRPFLSDLRRMRRSPQRLRVLSCVESDDDRDTATAA